MEKCYSKNNFINRELSWLEFNERVLQEAQDTNNPLLERLKFVAIVSSNLDEFFMIRVGSLYDQIDAGFEKEEPSGLTPKQQIAKISVRTHEMINDLSNCYNRSIKISMKRNKIIILREEELEKEQKEYIDRYYEKNIFPVLTPIVVDKSSPFPLVLNKSLNIALLIQDKTSKEKMFGTIQVPSVLERLVEIPNAKEGNTFILLEDIIKRNLSCLFNSHNIISQGTYRITRNADLSLDEEGAEDLLEAIEESLKARKWGSAVRLEYESGIDKRLLGILRDELETSKVQEYEINTPIDLTFLMKLSNVEGYDDLKYKKFKPQFKREFVEEKDAFAAISKGDILLHHPYESFEHIVDLIQQAAVDPNVLAIKQTLYRVSGNSSIVKALVDAAESGKQVTVLVELKARFDEENNINWAKRLEKAGCHVIYGLVGLKTHCKILLIVRREASVIKRYVHLGTGNYNDVTARLYTDMGLVTNNPYLGADASALFNMLSGRSEPREMHKIAFAPVNLRSKFLKLIKNEEENALQGKKAYIVAKMNSLVDKEIIEALYSASSTGVKIDLIIRGICCLKPGLKGISDNITVRSIVGRLLEHSRIFYFYADGEEKIFLSSADWMNRNLDRRVEILFPLEDTITKLKVKDILNICLKDNVKARILNSDGIYTKLKGRKRAINSQEELYNMAIDENSCQVEREVAVTFQPIIPDEE